MRSPANQRRRTRNRSNRRTPATPTNQRETIQYTPKNKYSHSEQNANGVLILSKRKRRLALDPAEVERKKQKAFDVKKKQVTVTALRHKVIALWQYGMNTPDLQFGPHNSGKITDFLQSEYPEKYGHRAAASSFFFRALKRHKNAAEQPHMDPFRDCRGENRRKTKRENADVVMLCDELLSEPKATAPKVQRGLRDNGLTVSLSTIYRVAKDLLYRWQKPWHTDILTPAQKLKRKLFCAELIRMSEPDLLRRLADWMWTDEKWWDLVGPAAYKYVKAATAIEGKMQNQVLFQCNFHVALFVFCSLVSCIVCF